MSESLGNKIKQLREAAGLSWGALAEATSLSSSKIALIESGEAKPSICVLQRIAKKLGVRLGTLLDGAESGTPQIADLSQLTPTVSTSGKEEEDHLDFFALAGSKSDRNMEPLYVKVNYTENLPANYSSHEGEEFIFVLEGEIMIHYGNDSYVLGKGQSIYYDSVVPHLVTVGQTDSSAKVLSITYIPN